LAKQHRYELLPAGESASMALGVVLTHQRLKLRRGKN